MMTATNDRPIKEPDHDDAAFLLEVMTDAEFEEYVRVANSDISIAEVEFFSPIFADE